MWCVTDKVLVTGGSGFLAGWCVSALAERGYEVRTTVRDPGRAPGGPRRWWPDLPRDEGWADPDDPLASPYRRPPEPSPDPLVGQAQRLLGWTGGDPAAAVEARGRSLIEPGPR
jgi:hypothetical protein